MAGTTEDLKLYALFTLLVFVVLLLAFLHYRCRQAKPAAVPTSEPVNEKELTAVATA